MHSSHARARPAPPPASSPPPTPPADVRPGGERRAALWTRRPRAARTLAGPLQWQGAWDAVFIQVTSGVFLTGYALALGASTAAIGALAALPLAARLTQLYTSWRVERAGHWRRSAVRGALAWRLPVLAAAALPWLPGVGGSAARAWGPWLLVAAVTAAALGASVFELAFLTWVAELAPPAARGRLLAVRNRAMSVIGVAASLAAGAALDAWRRAHPGRELAGFATLFAIGGAAALVGLVLLARVPEPRRAQSRATGPTLGEALRTPVRDPNFRTLLAFAGAWGVGVGITAPFVTVYLLRDLRVPFALATAIGALGVLAAAGAAGYWGRLIDHFGPKPVLRASTYLLAASQLPLVIAAPGRLWPVVVSFVLSGVGGAGFDLAVNALILELAPDDARPSYLASFGATYVAAQAVAPLAGGLLVQAATNLGFTGANAFGLLFVVAFALRAVATPIPGRVREPRSVSVGHLIRVMGRLRGMSVTLPLDALFRQGYTHLARLADYVAREHHPPGDARDGAPPGRAAR